MVQLIVGKKGKGKTKCLLDKVNTEVKNVLGSIAFLDKNTKHMYELNNKIRLIVVPEFMISNCDEFIGFVSGIISQDHDLQQMYFDSFLKISCLEGQDIEGNYRINDIAIPTDIQFTEKKVTISGHEMIALEGDAVLVNHDFWDNNSLYRDLRLRKQQKVRVRLIPYYAWDNRGIQDMSVWLNRGL